MCYPGGPILDSSTLVAATHGASSGPGFPPIQHRAVCSWDGRFEHLPSSSELASRSGTGAVVEWARSLEANAVARVAPRYGLNLGLVAAPHVVSDLLVSHLQSGAAGLDHSARLQQIVQVVMARVGANTWRSYGSHFAAFVRFCVMEGLEFLPASFYAGLLWGQFLPAKGTVQAHTAQPYFSAVNTIHDLLGYPKPCAGDNTLVVAFRKGWERLQVSLSPTSSLVLAFSVESAWVLYEALPLISVSSPVFLPLLFVVLGFCLFLRPDCLLSVCWARVVELGGIPVFQYKPLNWKGRVVSAERAPVLCGLSSLWSSVSPSCLVAAFSSGPVSSLACASVYSRGRAWVRPGAWSVWFTEPSGRAHSI
ncbi:hypothetical protein VaNZ11_002531 [Volvox africanus]|uniref:Uncharacterized protein n=1 Tax=Volvox africanus TaxID=51714 RepID=A0ABQ5RSU3_9CHLO|nr:hypothetical protein VaNZ11_002531 [Volvox africanus]